MYAIYCAKQALRLLQENQRIDARGIQPAKSLGIRKACKRQTCGASTP